MGTVIYRFDDCEIDTKLLEVRRGGRQQSLDPLEFDLLVYLVENRDRVVTRNELLDALWPGRVVTDSALSSRLKSVRAATGDSGKAQKVIRTAHGRGYRFVANLDDAPAAPAVVTEQAVPVTSAIGRDVELGKMLRWLDRAVGSYREIVLISGEAGVGKTTLTRAFLDAAQKRGEMMVMHGQCVNQRGASEAYLPLLEALSRAGAIDPSIAETLRRHAPVWLLQLPSLNASYRSELEQASVGTTPARMLREISDALDALSHDRQVILVLEDLHWSDPSTIEWLEYFARRDSRSRLMLIATSRPEGEQYNVCRELTARQHVHDLRLGAIDEASISDYLNNRLEHPPAPELAAITYRRTNGFPLFIDGLVEHWLANGLIERNNGSWVAASSDEELLAGVPDQVSQLIGQQLHGLDDTERNLVETAALAGSPFAAASIAHALGEAEEQVEALFGRMARQKRVVRNVGEVRWPDGTVTATFEFRHEVYREALYEDVTASRRARLHLALGERLEAAYGDRSMELAGQLADHFARAHEVPRALKYFYPAALRSFNRSANRESLVILNRAIELIGTLQEDEDALRVERELHLLRASALIMLEGWASEGVERSYTRAREIAEHLDIDDDSPEIYGIASVHELRGHYVKSQQIIESMIQSSSNVGLEANELLACSLFHQGKFEDSKRSADAAIAEFNPTELCSVLARYGENPGVCCHGWASQDLWFMGYPDSALERSDQALRLAEEHQYSLATALIHRAFLHQFRHEPEECERWAARTIEVAAVQGFDFRVAQASILGGWAKACLASNAEGRKAALEQLDAGIDNYAATGAEMDIPYFLTLRADVIRRIGNVEEALRVQEHALSMTGGSRAFFFEPEMHRLLALLLLAQDDPDRESAMSALDESLRIARQRGARMLELRTCNTRLRVLQDSERGATARQELETLLSSFEEGQDTPDWRACNEQ